MFEELAGKLDGVVISTPDHMHYPITQTAMNLGIHVYCEKPLTHTVQEARWIAEAARSNNLVTQMGNQGHSNEGTRRVREWLQAGVIGQVREVHSWTNRPIWPQGIDGPDHSKFIPVVPKELDWDLWLGVAEPRPYDPMYLPFRWRGFWDFGCGAIGDMACHIMNSAYWGLDLGLPVRIEATSTPINEYTAPESAIVRFSFPQRGSFDPMTYYWYEGGLLPPVPVGLDESIYQNESGGTLFIGEHAYILADSNSESVRILPDATFTEMKPHLPPKSLPRVKGSHQQDWTNAIRSGTRAGSHFEYAAGLTETVLLGNVAMQARRPLDYDGEMMGFTNYPEADRFLTKDYRDGWILS
jgi:predicted dehydrogenase